MAARSSSLAAAPAPAPAEVPEDLDHVITRVRQLAATAAGRELLAEAGIGVLDEDDDTLHLESLNEGVLEEQFQRAQRDIRRAFDDATTDGVRGKLKASFKSQVSFVYDTDKDLLMVEASATVSLPKGRAVARSASFGGAEGQPFGQQLETRRQPRLPLR